MGKPLQTLVAVFAVSFLLNYVWEHLHSVLYVHYKGGAITDAILLHATLMDAVMITGLAVALLFIPRVRRKPWLVLVGAFLLAAGIELWALDTGRWAYNASMPLVPLLHVGLSPTVQLALTGFVTFKICLKKFTVWGS